MIITYGTKNKIFKKNINDQKLDDVYFPEI